MLFFNPRSLEDLELLTNKESELVHLPSTVGRQLVNVEPRIWRQPERRAGGGGRDILQLQPERRGEPVKVGGR